MPNANLMTTSDNARPTSVAAQDAVPHLMFVVSEDWYFWSHRRSIAEAALQAGMRVTVVTNVDRLGPAMRAAGLNVVDLHIPRSIRTPWRDLAVVRQLAQQIRTLRPDVIHAVSVKTGLLVTAARRLAPGPAVVHAFGGLGRLVSLMAGRGPAGWLTRSCLKKILAAPRTHLILQNPEDREDLLASGATQSDKLSMIRGAGVCTNTFRPGDASQRKPVVLMACRMLWSKGVEEFVQAAKLLRQRGSTAEFVLAGRVDTANSDHVPTETLQAWTAEGNVRWVGDADNLPSRMREASVFCLPTRYGEGIPKVLLEAAASGLPLVVTDARGCREICHPDHNGLLVPPGDSESLAMALEMLLDNESINRRMGAASRQLAVREFAEPIMIQQTLDIYQRFVQLPAQPQRRAA